MIGKIRIEGDGFPRNTRFFLDDVDISRFVQNVTVGLGIDCLPNITVGLIGTSEFSDELRGLVTLYIADEAE